MPSRVRVALIVLLAGCARGEVDGPSTVALTEVDILVQGGSSSSMRRVEVAYEGGGGPIVDIALSTGSSSAGRMDASYADGRLAGFAIIDIDGDQGQLSFSYDDQDRLVATQYVAPSVYTVAQDYDYDDDRGGLAREVTTRVTPASGSPETSQVRFEYDEQLRISRITQVASQTSTALAYDDAGRLHSVSLYDGSSLIDTQTCAYDATGRITGITTMGAERWEVGYNDDGFIGQIRHVDPGNDETTTYTYGYGTGRVDGIRFVPDLPNASLFDLRGRSFATMDFLDLAPGELSASVPSPAGGPVCGDFVCESPETSSSCPADCSSGPVCGDLVCQSPETSSSCPTDCDTGPVCGDFVCESPETSTSCPTDCGTVGDSCYGNCGGSASTCYCDTTCVDYGDCCPDYQQECGGTTTDSCFGLCGSYADTCYCDVTCVDYGDCCPDYTAACG